MRAIAGFGVQKQLFYRPRLDDGFGFLGICTIFLGSLRLITLRSMLYGAVAAIRHTVKGNRFAAFIQQCEGRAHGLSGKGILFIDFHRKRFILYGHSLGQRPGYFPRRW